MDSNICPRCKAVGAMSYDQDDLRCAICGWHAWGYPRRGGAGTLPRGGELIARYAGPMAAFERGQALVLKVDEFGKFLVTCPFCSCGKGMDYRRGRYSSDRKAWYVCAARHTVWIHDRTDDDHAEILWG